MEMRQALGQGLAELMERDERVVVIDADLARANGTLKLRERFPDRAFDVGVAEQNMVSMAAGMASYGYIPFVTTFAPFAVRRVCDQLQLSVAYAGQNVKIVGSDPGISAELNGGTHMTFEDVGILRTIPTMMIFEPADARQLRLALPQVASHDGPVYIRMHRKTLPDVFDESYCFRLGRADVLRPGTDVSIFAGGIMLSEACGAAEQLAARGISAEVVNIHTVRPLDEQAVLKSVSHTRAAVTAENHGRFGGLYSAVSELLAERMPCPVERVSTEERFGEVGRFAELRNEFALDAEHIVRKALRALERKRGSE